MLFEHSQKTKDLIARMEAFFDKYNRCREAIRAVYDKHFT